MQNRSVRAILRGIMAPLSAPVVRRKPAGSGEVTPSPLRSGKIGQFSGNEPAPASWKGGRIPAGLSALDRLGDQNTVVS